MKCTFYRTNEVRTREWETIIEKMHRDLGELEAGGLAEEEVRLYIETLLSRAEPLEKDPTMRFFGFDKPEHMPSDCRVAYFYRPTYAAAAIVMKACLLYPGILERALPESGERAEEIFRAVLRACTGRGFAGAGYDDVKGLVETLEFFTDHGAPEYVRRFGHTCPEFRKCLHDALLGLLADVMQGGVTGAWGDDYTDRARDILEKAGMLTKDDGESEGRRLYLAYGSNLNIGQMRGRCPGAEPVGTAELKDWRLMFRKSATGYYLTIEQAGGYRVPVAVWAVSEEDEKNLDRYEGCPVLYYKTEMEVEMRPLPAENAGGPALPQRVKAFVYILPKDHEPGRPGRPAERYMKTCKEGYESFGFNPALLDEACAASSRG